MGPIQCLTPKKWGSSSGCISTSDGLSFSTGEAIGREGGVLNRLLLGGQCSVMVAAQTGTHEPFGSCQTRRMAVRGKVKGGGGGAHGLKDTKRRWSKTMEE